MSNQDLYDRTVDEPATPGDNGFSRMPNEPYYQAPARRGGAKIFGSVLIIIGVVWLISLFAGRFALPFGMNGGTLLDNSYNARRLVVDVSTGDIEVRTWSQPQVRVEATYRGGSVGDYAVSVEPQGDTLRISGGPKPFFPLFSPHNVRYQITLPNRTDARIKTVNGEIEVAELDGEVNLESANGMIRAVDIPRGLAVVTVNGEIQLDNIGGMLRANSTNGDIVLDNGQVNQAQIESVNGDVKLNGVAGDLTVKSVNGDIEIEEALESSLSLSTTNGDIVYEGALKSGGTNTVNTVSGDATLQLPSESSFDLSADTSSGDIETDFALQNQQQDRRSLSGKANGGGTMVKIGTTSGDIKIESR